MKDGKSSEISALVFALRALKNWSAEKASYAAGIIVIKKGRDLRRVVEALAIGATYREALRAGEVSVGHAARKLERRLERTISKQPRFVRMMVRFYAWILSQRQNKLS